MKLLKHLRFIKPNKKVIYKIFMETFFARFMGINRLRNVQIVLTHECNFKCKDCSERRLDDGKSMSIEQVKYIWDAVKRLGVMHVDLTGGEPFIMGVDYLCEIIKYITKKKDTIVSIATNGSLVVKDDMKRLKGSGLNTLIFDIRSRFESVHNDIVGYENSYGTTMRNMGCAAEAGLNVCVNTVLHSDNREDIRMLEKGCRKINAILCLNPLAGNKEKAISRDNYDEFAALPNARMDTIYNYRGKGLCPGGIEKWYILPNGDIQQCSFVYKSLGNIFKENPFIIYDRICSDKNISLRFKGCKHLFYYGER